MFFKNLFAEGILYKKYYELEKQPFQKWEELLSKNLSKIVTEEKKCDLKMV